MLEKRDAWPCGIMGVSRWPYLAGRPHSIDQLESKVTTAAADIQSRVSRLCLTPGYCHALPDTMEPQTQRVIQLHERSSAIFQH